MKALVYIFSACLVCSGIAEAEETTDDLAGTVLSSNPIDTIIDSVAVIGADSLLHKEITPVLLSKKGGILNEGLVEHDVDTLMDFLREHGWWKAHVTASVDSSSGGPAILTFEIFPGKPVFFGLITYNITEQCTGGSQTAPPGDVHPFVFSSSDKLYGTYFSKQALENCVDTILSDFTGDGYPGVTIAPSLRAYGDTVAVVLNITAGQRAHIDSIDVRGLARTKDYVIRRELSSLLGQPAGQDVAGAARSAVERLKFVRMVHPPLVTYDEEGSGVLAIGLTEGGQGSFDGVLGYQPSTGSESGEIIGKIDLGFTNMFGTGRSAKIRWENLGKNTEDLELQYREPWVFGFPYDASLSFMQEERENRGYTKTTLTTGLGRHIGKLRVDGGFRYEKVSADTLHSSKAAGFEMNITWATLDSPMNPSRGIRYSGSWSTVSKKYRFGSTDRTRLEHTEFDFEHYIPALPRQTAAVLVHYRRVGIPLKHLGPSDRYWLGGTATIRGYNESMFPAVKALWSTVEYRFLTGEASRVFVFVDTGYLVNRENVKGIFHKKTRTLTGYGFGLRLESRAGMLGFDYGLGRGDSPGDGKLHVSLRTEF